MPSTWVVIDAEMYAILAYLRKMASASDAQSRRCLVLCDCKPALQQIENAHRKGMPEGLRDWERGGPLEAIAYYRSMLEAVVFVWVPSHVGRNSLQRVRRRSGDSIPRKYRHGGRLESGAGRGANSAVHVHTQ